MGARGPKPIPFVDRAQRFIVADESGCHLWTGALDRRGYAKAGATGGRTVGVHRELYELEHGELTPDVHLHHTCGVRRCVNVAHLRPVTAAEHLAEHGTQLIGTNAAARAKRAATHCQRGHEFTPENTRIQNGHRLCRICVRERDSRRKTRAAA